MCIILIKPEKQDLPSEEILKNCFVNNPDGAGIMYTQNNQVVIKKGLMTYDLFKLSLDKIKKTINVINTPMVIHFRIGTQGKNNAPNTHPFPITDDISLLKTLNIRSSIGIAHNGIIDMCSDYSKKATLSDTQIFIKDYLTIIARNKNFYKDNNMLELIEKLTYSKFAILTAKNEIIKIGDFIEDNGIFYSNNSFQNNLYSKVLTGKKSVFPINKMLMFLPDCFIQKNNDYLDIEGYTMLIDKDGLIYEYNHTEDKAYYIGKFNIYDNNLNKIYFDLTQSDLYEVDFN